MDKRKLSGTIFFILIIIIYFIWGKKLGLSLGSMLAIPFGFLGLFEVSTLKLGNLWWKIVLRKYLFLLFIIAGIADLPLSPNLKLTVLFFYINIG